jgi:NADH:ubiquinone oxidoreductase subunit
MTFKEHLIRALTWWNGTTYGTQFYTWRHGHFVGEDEFGNKYYRAQGHVIDTSMGSERRWVIYAGETDLSNVPPGWRGWLTHTTDVPPSEESYVPRPWEKPALPNMTGTPQAYRPRGSIAGPNQRPAATGDYIPWTPGE